MTRLTLFARQERRSVTAAIGLAMAAILFAQMILPGAVRLAFHDVRGAPPQPGGGAESSPPPASFTPERPTAR